MNAWMMDCSMTDWILQPALRATKSTPISVHQQPARRHIFPFSLLSFFFNSFPINRCAHVLSRKPQIGNRKGWTIGRPAEKKISIRKRSDKRHQLCAIFPHFHPIFCKLKNFFLFVNNFPPFFCKKNHKSGYSNCTKIFPLGTGAFFLTKKILLISVFLPGN